MWIFLTFYSRVEFLYCFIVFLTICFILLYLVEFLGKIFLNKNIITFLIAFLIFCFFDVEVSFME